MPATRRTAPASGAAGGANGSGSRRGGPPRPRPTRPVTARVDTTHTFRPRNVPLRSAEGRFASAHPLPGQAPPRTPLDEREPPRASTPTGPLARSRLRNFRPAAGPPLDQAVDVELTFGKFHGHTLGQVAAFEPSYIDWLATTITRDRELVAAARVVRDDLDRRGVRRRTRAPAPPRRAARPPERPRRRSRQPGRRLTPPIRSAAGRSARNVEIAPRIPGERSCLVSTER